MATVKKRLVISIDPGIRGTGIAVWNANPGQWTKLQPPMHVGNLYPSSHANYTLDTRWFHAAQEIALAIESIAFEKTTITHAYIEYPSYFASYIGQAAAERGDLVKLTTLVGMLAHIFRDRAYLVPVNHWKGQLPKTVVEARIRSLLGDDNCNGWKSHTWDAVGIGLFMKGHFG